MKKRMGLLLASLALTGCTESADSIAREYRNANNEHIDALMMVTNETTARQMLIRVLKPMRERYESIDRKLGIMEQTWPKSEFRKEILESDGVHLYRSEYKVNAQRCSLELARIRDLLEQTVKKEQERLLAAGADGNVSGASLCPALNELVNTKTTLEPLRVQLERPKMEEVIRNFVGKCEPKLIKTYEQKQEIFKPKDLRLVN